MKLIRLLLDDILLLAGCGCILYGLSLWNAVITWIAAGLMLIGLAVLVGMRKRNAAE
jgi:LPXTG-motif cell wall-anchored protein